MNRLLRKKSFFSVLASVAAVSLAACGGGGSHSSALPQPAPLSSVAPAPYTGPLADAMFKITIPAPTKTAANGRRPAYVSSSTSKVVFTLNTASRLSAAQITSFNASSLGTKAVSLGGGQCPGSGPWTCTIPIQLPPGTDNLTISAQDSSSNVLSAQRQDFTLSAGIQNNLSTILDANVKTGTMSIAVTSGFCAGTFNVVNNGTVGTVGTTAVTFNNSYKDPANNTIRGPGLPLLTVNGHTDNNGGAGYTDATTHLNVKVTQSTQSFVLTQTAGTGNAAVTVTATPPNNNSSPNDQLSFSESTSFTFASGAAPPASFLAGIEQTNSTPGSAAGQIDLYTISLGTTDTFTPYGGGTLTPTPATPPKDVDNPLDLLFDPNGDLLIANGGSGVGGAGTAGSFSCVPAGTIANPGANNATIVTTHADEVFSLALGTDNSVAATNLPGAAPVHMVEYDLGAQYAEGSSTREIVQSDAPGYGTHNVVALPTTAYNPAGTYAVALTNGGNPNTQNSEIIIKRPNGTTTVLSDSNNTIAEPYVGYDPAHNELVVASSHACLPNTCGSGFTSYLNTYSVSGATPTLVQSQLLYSLGTTPPSSKFQVLGLAVSPSGYIAVFGGTPLAENVQVYDNVSGSRAPKFGPIPFDAQTTSGGGTYVYDNTALGPIVNAVRFLTGNKLIVSLQSTNSNYQGFWTFDVTQSAQQCTCYDYLGSAYGVSPKNTGLQKTTNHPLATAYKP